ncbi:MAG: IS66 family transposase, partial [Halieaceae bacterium]|nr:IS66 family transposase [Halieaceae bacterium]
AIRPIAIGRKNWLFAGSVRGGEAAAIMYSLVESCRQAQISPWAYLKDVLERLSTHPASEIADLVPARWAELRELSKSA